MNPMSSLSDPVVASALDHLAPEQAPDVEVALRRQRLMQRTAPPEPVPFWRRLAAPRFAGPIAAALVLAGSLFTSPVQSLAAQFLTVFRVQNVQPITVDKLSQPMPDLSRLGDMSPNPRSLQIHPTQVTNVAAATSQVGFNVLAPSSLPSGLANQPSVIAVTNGATLNFTFRADKARQYLDSTGHKDVVLPPKFDGASLQLQVNPAASLAYLPAGTSMADIQAAAGAVESKPGPGNPVQGVVQPHAVPAPGEKSDPGNAAALNKLLNGSSVLLIETKSPVLSASGVSADDLRNFLLSLPNLPADTKAQLQAIGDWSNTLPVPVTPGSNVHKVTINGAPGVAGKNGSANMVLWVSNGIVFVATGPNVDEGTLINLANSVK
ncbi:MAG: hypothetical protein JO247_19535 [Chloroflexi bacterium]|nr:hypothetical protein [Chloroflexota bacterium]